MPVYYSLIAGASLLGALLCWKHRSRVKDGIFLLTVFSVLAVLSAIRYHVGVDYSYVYSPDYASFLADPTGEALWSSRFEPGFKVLCWITSSLSQNYQTLFVVTSILIMALVGLYYWLHSPNPFISVFLFLTLSQYYCSMNFMRQTLAAAIALHALPLARKRTFAGIGGYFALVLLAASFHKSALILIPAYFLFQLPFNKWVLGAYAVVTALLYFNTHRILAIVTQYWYTGYQLDSKHMTAVFEFQFTAATVVALLILLLGSRVLKKRSSTGTVYLHCAYFSFFFVLMGTRHSIVDRLSLYFTLITPVAVAVVVHYFGTSLAKKSAESVPPWRPKAFFAALLAAVYCGGLYMHWFALGKDYHGVEPYETIFQQDFYPAYVAGLRGEYLAPREDNLVEPEEPEDLEQWLDAASSSGEPLRPQPPAVDPFQPEPPADGSPAEVPLEQVFH